MFPGSRPGRHALRRLPASLASKTDNTLRIITTAASTRALTFIPCGAWQQVRNLRRHVGSAPTLSLRQPGQGMASMDDGFRTEKTLHLQGTEMQSGT